MRAAIIGAGRMGMRHVSAVREIAEVVGVSDTRSEALKAVAAERVSLDEYMELLGTTQPLPQHAARVTAPVVERR